MPSTMTRGADSVQLPDPAANDYSARTIPNREVQLTSARKKTVVELGEDAVVITATFRRLSQAQFDALENFLVNVLDWQANDFTYTDHNAVAYENMYYIPSPDRGIDVARAKGNIYDVTLRFENNTP